MTSNGTHTFTYNTANQMVTSSVGSYVYDGHNKRVKTLDGQGTSYSMYSRDGTLVYRNVDGVPTDYYHLGKKLVARKKGSTVTYIHADYLGSPTAETNTSGSVTSRLHYQPFGESIETPKDEVGYTGHKFDKDLGLSYMQARYYDPVIGRFYSNDPLSFRDVHSFNRYAYANNNPYKYVDPDGRETLAILQMDQWQRSYQNGDISRAEYVSGEQVRVGGTVIAAAIVATRGAAIPSIKNLVKRQLAKRAAQNDYCQKANQGA